MSEKIKDSKHMVPDDSVGFEKTESRNNTHDLVVSHHNGEKSTDLEL